MIRKAGALSVLLTAGLLLTGCANKTSTESTAQKVHYIKTSVMYDTLLDIYNNKDQYLGETLHMVGLLYPSKDENEDIFYSIYAEPQNGGEGIGLELDWSDFSEFEDFDKVMVEGKLEQTTVQENGSDREILILRVSTIEKRD